MLDIISNYMVYMVLKGKNYLKKRYTVSRTMGYILF